MVAIVTSPSSPVEEKLKAVRVKPEVSGGKEKVLKYNPCPILESTDLTLRRTAHLK